ncbi:unnamed protein product [marine sediment metagenome]|uniref:Uncharacterized protein n=1 Tax=marine sediment metagenome TaxID=412755 RepID=X1QWG8_9ZZZZ
MNQDLAWDMGRQKTLWIDEDCWSKLERMEGDSVSDKVRRCIKQADTATDALEQALRRRIKYLEDKLKSVGWKGD